MNDPGCVLSYVRHAETLSDSWFRAARGHSGLSRVPRRIMQTGSAHAAALHLHRVWMQNWSEMNPEYDYNFFGDVHASRFVSSHGSMEEIMAYKSLVTGAQRADVFRILYLRTVGGVYADIDVQPRLPLAQVIQPNATGLAGRWWPFEFLAFSPGHPILAHAARIVTTNILREGSAGRCSSPHTCVIEVTGPTAYHAAVRAATQEGGCRPPRLAGKLPGHLLCQDAHDPWIRGMTLCSQDKGTPSNSWACGVARHWDCLNARPQPTFCRDKARKHYSTGRGHSDFFDIKDYET